MSMFQIKICGITSVDDALVAARAGADAVGLNFYPRSPRYVTPERALEIVTALPGGVLKVGLFVNASADEILRACEALRLDLIQLHGDEPPELLRTLARAADVPPVLRAFRLSGSGDATLQPVLAYLERCRVLGCLPRMVLLDAAVPGQFGGTGQTADWATAALYPLVEWHPPLVLAGGLRPDNVAAAIKAVRPSAVDTASGVESAPGRKDPAAVEVFVRAARAAFNSLPPARP